MGLLFRALAFAATGLLPLGSGATIVGDWNNAALAEVRANRLGPPIVARALAVAHTCMYDAWTAYDGRAMPLELAAGLRRPPNERTDANKAKAISFAAFRCLANLFPAGTARLEAVMRAHGYDPADASLDPTLPQGIGNRAAVAVVNNRRNDGANQYGLLGTGPYADYTGYAPRNAPMPFCLPDLPAPCKPVIADPYHWQPLIAENGTVQKFIAPHWERVRPFALSSSAQFDDFAPPPHYLGGFFAYLSDVNSMVLRSAFLNRDQKLIVEYWADGPASELPPGHWGLFAQFISKRDNHSIDQDVKMFFAMHNASFDAGIVAWHLKRKYDGVRPITAVRYVMQGQTIFAWGGPGEPNRWIAGEKWSPYNPGSNLTPAFPGYVSGHSSFSRASATVLRAFTGSDDFGFSTVIPANFGRVEPGIPPVPTTLSYRTFDAAADEAGLSRLLGGIHFDDDNAIGQDLGARVGEQAWSKAQFLFDGGLAAVGPSSVADDAMRAGFNTYALAWPHTVEPTSNRVLLVSLSHSKYREPAVSVTYGGVAMRRLVTQSGTKGGNRIDLWYLVSPKPGTADVVARFSRDMNVTGGAMTLGGVDTAAPFGTLQNASDAGSRACVTLANTPADLVVLIVAAEGAAQAVSAGNGQTQQWTVDTGTQAGDVLSSASTVAAAPVATLCQTLKDAQPWTLLAVPVNAAFAQ